VQKAGIPTVECPVTRRPLVLIAAVLEIDQPSRVNCPSCGREHIWHPVKLKLVDIEDSAAS
jgi:hypothetical protein